MIIAIPILICLSIALFPIALVRVFRNSKWTAGWAVFLMVVSALGAWMVRGVMAEQWKSDQSMHIRWNVVWLWDQYARIDKLGSEGLRRDYVTNFCNNAGILLNLDCKTNPSTSNMVNRYYVDWEERIDSAERAVSALRIDDQNGTAP